MKKKYYYILLMTITLVSCEILTTSGNELDIENKPLLTLELEKSEGKEIEIYSPTRFYSQKIKASDLDHSLNFYIGELVLIYDSENSNYRSMNGMKKGAIIKILEKEQKLKGVYSKNFESISITSNKNDVAIRNYFELLKEPYNQIFRYNFEWSKFNNGINRTKDITDSILNSEINNDTKINILMSQLKWKQLSKSSEAKYLSSLIDSTKVSEILWRQYLEKREFQLVNYSILDTINVDFLESFRKDKRIALNSLDKDINILFFTAKWCGPCKSYIKPLKRIKEKYKNQVEIIGISFDNNPSDFEDYKKDKNFKFVCDLKGLKESKNSKEFNVKSLPSIIIFDGKKRVLINRTQSDLIEKQIDGIIKYGR